MTTRSKIERQRNRIEVERVGEIKKIEKKEKAFEFLERNE